MDVTEQDIENWIGENLGDVCPNCGSIVWTDKTNTKWCDSSKCNWSNDPEFEKELIQFWNSVK